MNPVSKTQWRGGFLLGAFKSLATLRVVPGLSWERTLTGRKFAVEMVRT
jgi:hypothetical protein